MWVGLGRAFLKELGFWRCSKTLEKWRRLLESRGGGCCCRTTCDRGPAGAEKWPFTSAVGSKGRGCGQSLSNIQFCFLEAVPHSPETRKINLHWRGTWIWLCGQEPLWRAVGSSGQQWTVGRQGPWQPLGMQPGLCRTQPALTYDGSFSNHWSLSPYIPRPWEHSWAARCEHRCPGGG